MFVVVKKDDFFENKAAYLFDTKEEAIKYMLKDYENTRMETFDNREEIYNRRVFDCKTYAFIETDLREYSWDVIEVFDN